MVSDQEGWAVISGNSMSQQCQHFYPKKYPTSLCGQIQKPQDRRAKLVFEPKFHNRCIKCIQSLPVYEKTGETPADRREYIKLDKTKFQVIVLTNQPPEKIQIATKCSHEGCDETGVTYVIPGEILTNLHYCIKHNPRVREALAA